MAPGKLLGEDDCCSSYMGTATNSYEKDTSGSAMKFTRQSIPSPSTLDIESLPTDTVSKFFISITSTALTTVEVPVYAYRSSQPGETIGITCAIHGNEVNGIPVIQKIFRAIEDGNMKVLKGTVIGIPVVNVPGFLASIRCFDDESKQDLNRLMPGKIDGAAPQQYAYRFFNNIVTRFDYLIDLHTASLGRRNSLYVRADMNVPAIAKLANLMKPQVLVHVGTGGSLRGCAQQKGIKALTVEIGNASSFQPAFIEDTYSGIRRVMSAVGISSPMDIQTASKSAPSLNVESTIVCTSSFWIFSQTGGILRVYKDIAERVRPGELIAEIQTVFGESIEKVFGPTEYETVVVGVEANPVAKSGNRIVHLGVIGDSFGALVNDGHL